MNAPENSRWIVPVYFVGVLGTFGIVIGLILAMYYYSRPAPADQGRAEERRKNLAELQAQSQEITENDAWTDQFKGVVRLPVKRAMELSVAEGQNPQAARSNLLARLALLAPPPLLTNQPATNPPATPK